MAQSAFRKYLINQLPDSAGDITSGSIAATLGTFGSCTISWQKVGKLYFNLKFRNIAGTLDVLFLSDVDTTNQVMSILGLTLDTAYTIDTYGAYTGNYSGGVWIANPPANNNRVVLTAFLST